MTQKPQKIIYYNLTFRFSFHVRVIGLRIGIFDKFP